jgi:hypothetical protein
MGLFALRRFGNLFKPLLPLQAIEPLVILEFGNLFKSLLPLEVIGPIELLGTLLLLGCGNPNGFLVPL